MAILHALILAYLHNLYSLRWLVLKVIALWYRTYGFTDYMWDKDSNCWIKDEFVYETLHIDKSNTFGEEFWSRQTTWHCGLGFVFGEIALSLLLIFLLNRHNLEEYKGFQKRFGKRFEA